MNCDLKWASAFVLIVSFSLKLRTILGQWGNTLLTAFKLELFTLMNVRYLNIVQAALCLYSTLFIISRLNWWRSINIAGWKKSSRKVISRNGMYFPVSQSRIRWKSAWYDAIFFFPRKSFVCLCRVNLWFVNSVIQHGWCRLTSLLWSLRVHVCISFPPEL